MIDLAVLNELNAPTPEERLENLRRIAASGAFPSASPQYINNHIHTIYSFSPYSPSAAVYAARSEGLCAAGIVDHDTLSGAREFIEAGAVVGLPVTVGMECRVSMAGTPFAELRTNNPDQLGVSYVTLQSIPHDRIETVNAYFAPYRRARHRRNRAMVDRINGLLAEVRLEYERDVLPLSQAAEGGSVTERHLMYALAKAMTERVGKGRAMEEYLAVIGLVLSEKQRAQILDAAYPFYEYDLLGILKSAFMPRIYIDADEEECPPLCAVARLCGDMDALLCYAYLGDVTESVTGDKRAQSFEDGCLDELVRFICGQGVRGLTYMPTRNSPAQLARVRALGDAYGLIQVSGEDINSPRQSFVIRAMDDPAFSNLIASTWRLIDHETKGAKL